MSVPAVLKYLGAIEDWDHTKPYQLIGRLAKGVKQNNLVFSTHDVAVYDIREANLHQPLDLTGFQWIKHPLTEKLDDNDSIARHIHSLEETVKSALNVKGVMCFDWQVFHTHTSG